MKYKNLKFIGLLLSTLLFNNLLFSKEVYKTKAIGNGPDRFKQYAMKRTNDNTGFIFSGTTKTSYGYDVIHIVKTDNTFNTTWSYIYMEVVNHSLNSTGIAPNHDGNGYWVCGYWGNNVSLTYPYLMEIDENGNVLQHILGETEGAYLDVAATSDDGCIAVGFISANVISEEVTTGRRALINKFTSTLGVTWSRTYHASAHSTLDNFYYESAENVVVINNASSGSLDQYFVTGNVSDMLPSAPRTSLPNLFYTYIDNTGTFIYKHTCLTFGSSFDIVYEPNDDKIYYVGKWDKDPSDYQSVVGKISVNTGSIDFQKLFEGSGSFPYAHNPVPYKIEFVDNQLMMFGYVRTYNFNAMSGSTNIMIPFHATLNKDNASQISFVINHSDTMHTARYPSEDPGFLHAWEAINGIFGGKYPSIYAPEMACSYTDDEEFHWGMVGYYNQTGGLNIYDLHMINSQNNGECDPLDRDLSMVNYQTPDIETEFLVLSFTTQVMTIDKFTLSLDDESCN